MAFAKNKTARQKKNDIQEEAPGSRRPRQSATSYSLWLLSQRDYSAADLRKKLASKEYLADEIETALAYVQENRYQDDARFARLKAEAKSSRMGDRRIRQVLAEKGIESEVIAAQMDEMAPEEERVIAAAARFEGRQVTPELKQKVFRFLAYRGFSSGAIRRAIAHLAARAPEVLDGH